jgi:hypothetical protein
VTVSESRVTVTVTLAVTILKPTVTHWLEPMAVTVLMNNAHRQLLMPAASALLAAAAAAAPGTCPGAKSRLHALSTQASTAPATAAKTVMPVSAVQAQRSRLGCSGQ